MPLKKILFLLPHYWYVENHIEYIIRYLGDQYDFDIGIVLKGGGIASYPDNYKHPYYCFYKNPDDYDLLISLLSTHTFLGKEYNHKLASVVWEEREIGYTEPICFGSVTPITDETLRNTHRPFVSTRIGIDTELFKPYPLARQDNLLRIGFVGKVHSPRKQVKDVLMPLADLEGIKLMFFVQEGLQLADIEYCGGKPFLERITGGHRSWIGMPNIYNQLDVLIETDADPSVSFPILEAAACGKPIITTYGGISGFLTDKGAGILIEGTRDEHYANPKGLADKIREAVIWMRDNPEERKEMGKKGREVILNEFNWEELIPTWKKFIDLSLSLIK